MSKLIVALMMSVTVVGTAHAGESEVWAAIGGGMLGYIIRDNQAPRHYHPHTTIIYQNAPPVVYAPPPVVYYQSPRPVTPLYGNTCPIVDGVQTVPILQTNRYGYHERVGCGYQY